MSMLRFLSVLVCLTGAISVGAVLIGGGPLLAQEAPPQIVVTGEGRASAAPDMAVIRFGVVAEAPRAQSAMDDVSEDVRAVFSAILDYGVAPRDIQTTALRLDPIRAARNTPGEAPEITGFAALNEITLRLRDMTSLGAVLQSVLDAGANRFSDISFTIADPAPLRDRARRDAVADAQAKAALYAEAAGVALGPVLTIREAGASGPAPMQMAEARMLSSAAVPIAEGALDITAQVTITFAIAQ